MPKSYVLETPVSSESESEDIIPNVNVLEHNESEVSTLQDNVPNVESEEGESEEGECEEGECENGECEKGECEEGECENGECEKGECEKGECEEGECENGECEKGECEKGECENDECGNGECGNVQEMSLLKTGHTDTNTSVPFSTDQAQLLQQIEKDLLKREINLYMEERKTFLKTCATGLLKQENKKIENGQPPQSEEDLIANWIVEIEKRWTEYNVECNTLRKYPIF